MSRKTSDRPDSTLSESPAASTRIQFELSPTDNSRLANLCGPFNEHMQQIETYYKVEINSRSNQFEVVGDGRDLKPVKTVIQTLYNVAGHEHLTPASVQLYLTDNIAGEVDGERGASFSATADNMLDEKKYTAESSEVEHGETVEARLPYSSVKNRRGKVNGRGKSQQQYLQQIKTHDLTLGVGPAGTGKTYLAVASAVEALENDQVDRVVLVRPAVEAGERLGFLPGDLAQKIDPYLRPMYDALFEMMGQQKVAKAIERQVIEIAPLAYMRGRTLNDSFIILDEAQNTTIDQMKMFLTRIGFGSKAVVTGDITQVDLPREKTSGLRHAIKILENIKGVGITHFNKGDIVRHPLVKKIVHAYEQDEVR